MKNLLHLDKTVHDLKKGENLKGKFNHNLIEGETEEYKWDSGIEQLRRQLRYGINEKPFPKHIREEIGKRKQIKLKNFVKEVKRKT